jgi:hypothetical protein
LYDCLAEHPEVFLPVSKDVNFFRRWWNEPSLYETYGLGPYESLYHRARACAARGDVSAGLLAGDGVAARMHAVLPDCKLIVILRHPVDRALSHHHYVSGRSAVPYTLKDLVKNPTLEDPHEILREGLYARHLETFFRYYPKDRFLILQYSDLAADPRTFFRTTCRFLGVNPEVEPSGLYQIANRPHRFRSQALHHWNRRLGTFLLVHRMNGLKGLMRRTGLPALVRCLNEGAAGDRPELDAETRRGLLDYYRDDVGRLEQVLGLNLDAWRQ